MSRFSPAILLGAVLLSCSSSMTGGSGSTVEPAQGDAAFPGPDAGNVEVEASAGQDDASPDDAASSTDVVSATDGEDPGPLCPAVAPASCPTPMPSYAQDVAPVLNAKCNGCHTGAPGAPWALTDWADVNAWALSIGSDIARCTMPPTDAGAPVLTKAETDAVLGWIVCSAPNN